MLNLARFFAFQGHFQRFRTVRHWEVGSKLGSKFLFFKTVFATVFFLSQIVVHFLRFRKDIFLRVVGIASVHGGSLNVLIPRMPVPEHDEFVVDAALFIVRTKRNVKLVFV